MKSYDVILSPTMMFISPPLGIFSLDQPYADFVEPATASSCVICLFNMTDVDRDVYAAPCDRIGGRIGVMFAGRYGDGATLFRLASQIEAAAPWFDRVAVI